VSQCSTYASGHTHASNVKGTEKLTGRALSHPRCSMLGWGLCGKMKGYCCAHGGKGCDKYDCDRGLATALTTWCAERREWCCATYSKGCWVQSVQVKDEQQLGHIFWVTHSAFVSPGSLAAVVVFVAATASWRCVRRPAENGGASVAAAEVLMQGEAE